MVINNNKVIVEVPHRISGFFEIVDEKNGKPIKDPAKIGSRGAGFNVSALGKTIISYKELNVREESKCKIYINNTKLNQAAETTYYIFNYVKKLIKPSLDIKIEHFFDLPVGCGYGSSGSGALGTIFGLSKLLNLKLSYKEKGRLAHISEVVNKTGLGTVCGQLGGGLCILKESGYPCIYENIKTPNTINVICGSFGTIRTKAILSDPLLKSNIKNAGKVALKKIMLEPSIKTFIRASIEFVKQTKIREILGLEDIIEVMDSLNKLNIIGASMNQLGRSIYVFCRDNDINNVFEILESYKPVVQIYNLKINDNPAINIKNLQ
jgi:pantoate kinase